MIAEAGLSAKKTLGQNFLLDLNLTARIVRGAGRLDGVTVVEIGPGPGGLTRPLVTSEARAVVAIERDRRAITALEDLVEAARGRLTLIEGDALDVDVLEIAPAPRAIVANLPYNVATPLLVGWLARMDAFESLTLMVQKEVGDRLLAPVGTKAYGRLSVITQWRARIERVLTVPARAFTPPPKVDGTVVRLTPHPDPGSVDPPPIEAVERVTAAAFGQRRKMLRQSLKPLGPPEPLLAAAGLSPEMRAEDVPVEGYVALARALGSAGVAARSVDDPAGSSDQLG